MFKKIPEQLEDEIVSLYNNGNSILSVSIKTGVSRGSVINILTRNEIKIRPGKTQSPSFLDFLSDVDLAYIAGFIDGEGCICVHRRGKVGEKEKSIYAFIVTIANTDKSVIQYLHSVLGGCIANNNKRNGHKTCYVLHLNPRKAYKLLKKLLPYLRVKKKQAELAIKLGDIITNKKHGRLTNEDVMERELIRQEMQRLNKRVNKRKEGGENSGK